VSSLIIKKKKKLSDGHNKLARKRTALQENWGQPRQVKRDQPSTGEGWGSCESPSEHYINARLGWENLRPLTLGKTNESYMDLNLESSGSSSGQDSLKSLSNSGQCTMNSAVVWVLTVTGSCPHMWTSHLLSFQVAVFQEFSHQNSTRTLCFFLLDYTLILV
jgi:hypothetical protein